MAELSAEATRARSSDAASDPTHGRFSPGDILSSRYRIVERVGKGGMGEVYHADDLTLEQPVALKFLPEALAHDEERLKRFRREVRIARQIAHPNVCRVYDIGEANGLVFLSMEYIDGKDLGSLLRRIGRLPPDKAVEIASQLASGLAAAHDAGVLHRDLKPANIMLDDRGQARITDFGLAAAAGSIERDDIRSGTPAYMAPEQRTGQEVTEKSDLYSLGLVFYEMFTGKRAFEKPQDTTPTSPSSWVEGIDPAVERVILRCLEKEPKDRPASALAVRAALPGGDPLAAAVAAGETPAPELVAEAGETGALRPGVAWALLGTVLLSLPLGMWMHAESSFTGRVPLPKSPELLVADARRILVDLGYSEVPRDSTYGFARETGYIDHLMAAGPTREWWGLLGRREPSVLELWYRQSPAFLVPHRTTEFFANEDDPPSTVPGTVNVRLDTFGRLRRLEAVPPRVDESDERVPMDWQKVLAAAGFDKKALTPVEPEWFPTVFADERVAFTGSYPEAPEISFRIEAASFRGRPVAFRIIHPWTKPPEGSATSFVRPSDSVGANWARLLHLSLNLALIGVLALFARHNLRVGRGDRKIAFRVALFLFSMEMLHWLFGAHHVAERSEADIVFGGLYQAFYTFGLVWLFYLAIEPYARRLWPRTLTSWVRIFRGRFRDPLVGRDLLIGCAWGAVYALSLYVYMLLPGWLGKVPPRPDLPWHYGELIVLTGLSDAVSQTFSVVTNVTVTYLYIIVGLLVLRLILRKTWLAVGATFVLMTAIWAPSYPYWGFIPVGLVSCAWLYVFLRFGWLPAMVGAFVLEILLSYPLTVDFTVWYAYATYLVALVVLATAIYGFQVSLAGRPAFGELMAEE